MPDKWVTGGQNAGLILSPYEEFSNGGRATSASFIRHRRLLSVILSHAPSMS